LKAVGTPSGHIDHDLDRVRNVSPTNGQESLRSTCFYFLDDLMNNATCFARRIAALSNLRLAPARPIFPPSAKVLSAMGHYALLQGQTS
jgi:hypothetical protein